MRVKVTYPIVRTMEIEIPDELAKPYKEAEEKEHDDDIWETSAKIYDYLESTIPQIDADADYKPDIYDWDEVE